MFGYGERAERNKQKIIKKDVKRFKRRCLREFRRNIKKGLKVTCVDFNCNVDGNFEEETSIQVLNELTNEHKEIEFSFCYRHFNNSYKGIQMVAK